MNIPNENVLMRNTYNNFYFIKPNEDDEEDEHIVKSFHFFFDDEGHNHDFANILNVIRAVACAFGYTTFDIKQYKN